MGNSVSLSMGVEPLSFPHNTTISHTSGGISVTTAVTTPPTTNLDFPINSKEFRSQTSFQISTYLSSNDFPSTPTPLPRHVNCSAEEDDRSLHILDSEEVGVGYGLIHPRTVNHSEKGQRRQKRAPPRRGVPNPSEPQKDVPTGPPNSAVILPATNKPMGKQEDNSTHKDITVPERQSAAPQKKEGAKEQALPAPNKPDLESRPAGDLFSQDKPPIPMEEVKQISMPAEPSARSTPAAQPEIKTPAPPVQAPTSAVQKAPKQPIKSAQAEGKVEVKDTKPVEEDTTKKSDEQKKESQKGKVKIVYIPKKPIQLFGRPHKHHAQHDVEDVVFRQE